MPRPRSKSRDELISNAMQLFWKNGFHATSIDDLVMATGVSRSGIYSDFGGKDALFLACLKAFRARMADPAIALLTSNSDGLKSIEDYFDYFIALYERHGMPGPGCFIANTMIELSSTHTAAMRIVNKHSSDLKSAFSVALNRAVKQSESQLGDTEISEIAEFLVTSSQGLLSYGKSVSDILVLKRFKATLIRLLRVRLGIA